MLMLSNANTECWEMQQLLLRDSIGTKRQKEEKEEEKEEKEEENGGS